MVIIWHTAYQTINLHTHLPPDHLEPGVYREYHVLESRTTYRWKRMVGHDDTPQGTLLEAQRRSQIAIYAVLRLLCSFRSLHILDCRVLLPQLRVFILHVSYQGTCRATVLVAGCLGAPLNRAKSKHHALNLLSVEAPWLHGGVVMLAQFWFASQPSRVSWQNHHLGLFVLLAATAVAALWGLPRAVLQLPTEECYPEQSRFFRPRVAFRSPLSGHRLDLYEADDLDCTERSTSLLIIHMPYNTSFGALK